jgi:hypothetical protein
MRTQFWSLALVVALGPTVAGAADVYMRQERNGQGIEFRGSDSASPEAGSVPSDYPTEPIGCKPADGTTVCSLSNAADYGWPSVSVYTPSADSYNTVINFWNNESVLADQTQYPAGQIKNPWDRSLYTVPHVQQPVPADYWTDGWPTKFVTGNAVVKASNSATSFSVVDYTGNSVEPGPSRTWGEGQRWIDPRHYPASYPMTYKGCHQSSCTANGGAPFPIQVRDLGSIPSNWKVSVGDQAASSGIFDIAYDIWFDIGQRSYPLSVPWARSNGKPGLPEGANLIMQPYGTELMIWIGAEGFAGFHGNNQGKNPANWAITPAGSYLKTVPDSSGTLWDIYIGQGRDPKQSEPTTGDGGDKWNGYWNIVSFIRQEPTDTLNVDTRWFVNQLLTLNTCSVAYDASSRAVPGQTNAPCLQDTWWLTEIGAGFEIWREGKGLVSESLTVAPTFRDSPELQALGIQGINIMTDRWTDESPKRPLINWQKHIQLWSNSSWCNATGDQAGFDIETADSFQDSSSGFQWCDGDARWYSANNSRGESCGATSTQGTPISMVRVNGTPGQWYAILDRTLWERGMHGETKIHFYCNGSEEKSKTVSLFIDPSGKVSTVSGAALPGATVKLYRWSGSAWRLATNTPALAIMSPKNTTNPDVTLTGGEFGWDVIPGTYYVTAEKAGCYAPGTPSQPIVQTGSLVVSQATGPIFGLDLRLECPATTTPGGDTPGLQVTVTTINSWSAGSKYGKGGFCKGVRLKNTTSHTITGWQVTVPVERGTLYDKWNALYSQPSNTQVRIKNADNWLQVLQPGQQSDVNALGFCADRL